jgi:hypothetical protein
VGCDSNDSGETKPPLDFAETAAACTDGTAGEYPCRNVDLLARLSPTDLGVTSANAQVSDLWGWTDPQTSAQYALVGHPGGTAFVDVSDPRRPVYLGSLPSRGGPGAIQRDVKVYDNHAFVVAEADDHEPTGGARARIGEALDRIAEQGKRLAHADRSSAEARAKDLLQDAYHAHAAALLARRAAADPDDERAATVAHLDAARHVDPDRRAGRRAARELALDQARAIAYPAQQRG